MTVIEEKFRFSSDKNPLCFRHLADDLRSMHGIGGTLAANQVTENRYELAPPPRRTPGRAAGDLDSRSHHAAGLLAQHRADGQLAHKWRTAVRSHSQKGDLTMVDILGWIGLALIPAFMVLDLLW